eukprot:3995295-Prymnesium_polylepis.1
MARAIGARASDTTTHLAIVSAGDFDSYSFKALVVSSGMIDATALGKAKVVLRGVENAGLSRVFGAGKWQQLFDDATPSVLPAAAAAVAGGDPLVGSRLNKATIPVVVAGDVELFEGDWAILSVDAAGKYKLAALIGGVRVEHT